MRSAINSNLADTSVIDPGAAETAIIGHIGALDQIMTSEAERKIRYLSRGQEIALWIFAVLAIPTGIILIALSAFTGLIGRGISFFI